MPTQIADIDEARSNIKRFQDILSAEHIDKPARVRFSFFKDWYYDAELDAFGPGKFIGNRDTSVENYTGEGDGGETHKVLAHFYDPLDPAGTSYIELYKKLLAFSAIVGKNIGTKFLTAGGIFVPKLGFQVQRDLKPGQGLSHALRVSRR